VNPLPNPERPLSRSPGAIPMLSGQTLTVLAITGEPISAYALYHLMVLPPIVSPHDVRSPNCVMRRSSLAQALV